VLLFLLALACADPEPFDPEDTSGPPAAALERHHALVETPVQSAVSPTQVGFLEVSAITWVLDSAAGRVHLLDPHFHHSRVKNCLGTREWPFFEVDAESQGDCDDGEVELHRGWVAPAAPPVAVAADEGARALWVVDEQGGLSRVPADPMQENPFDHLRLEAPVPLELDAGYLPLSEGYLAVFEEALLLAAGDRLFRFDREGALREERVLSGQVTALALVGEEPWVATRGALWQGEVEVAVDDLISALVPDGEGGVWAALPGASRLARFRPGDDVPVEEIEVSELTGALARDPGSGRLYAATAAGIAAWDLSAGSPAGEAEVAGGPADALYVTGSHEILALREGTLVVASDEGAMEGAPPVSLFMVVTFERPKSSSDEFSCTAPEGEESLETWSARALRSLPFVAALPVGCALGVVPELLEPLAGCGLLAGLAPWWESACDAGPLFHTEHGECGADQDCHLAALQAERDLFVAQIPEPRWISGLAPLADDGAEWPEHVQRLGLGDLPLLHIGMDLDPAISHTDPRAKEPYPPEPYRMTAAWRSSSTADLAPPGSEEGFLAIYPGDDWPGFSHGGCPNLFIGECGRLNLGGGATFATEDIQGLDVLVHRAIARRSAEGPATWGFYLPDPGQYDYTAGCQEEDGIFSGEDCQAAALQGWLLGIDERFVRNGLAAWRRPSELERP
jgi:hypothetical protein